MLSEKLRIGQYFLSLDYDEPSIIPFWCIQLEYICNPIHISAISTKLQCYVEDISSLDLIKEMFSALKITI